MGETLETALAAFATQRSRQIANVIIELGREALKDFQPPRERKNLAFHKAWLAHVGNPRARTWCLGRDHRKQEVDQLGVRMSRQASAV